MIQRNFGRETKFQQVRTGLESLARQLGPDARFPPVRELGARFGTGVNTIAGALDDLEARDIIYRRERVGVFVSSSLSRTICFLMAPDFFGRGHAPFWDSLLRAAQLRAQIGREHFELHLAQSATQLGEMLEENMAKRSTKGHISGVVGVGLREDAARWFGEHDVPFVSLFGPSYGKRSASVQLDSHAMIAEGFSHLQSLGCSRVECWAPARLSQTRAEALATLKRQGVPASGRTYANFLAPGERMHLSVEEQGFELARSVFSASRSTWPDGIVSTDDRFTQGVLMALYGEKVEIGRDVQLATHANSDTPTFVGHRVPFWLLEYDVGEIVEATHEVLEALIKDSDVRIEERRVRPHLRPHHV
jgi:DNA-binding LacI/PurR family transcriptional regulator